MHEELHGLASGERIIRWTVSGSGLARRVA
jgi:hypothetical protein